MVKKMGLGASGIENYGRNIASPKWRIAKKAKLRPTGAHIQQRRKSPYRPTPNLPNARFEGSGNI